MQRVVHVSFSLRSRSSARRELCAPLAIVHRLFRSRCGYLMVSLISSLRLAQILIVAAPAPFAIGLFALNRSLSLPTARPRWPCF